MKLIVTVDAEKQLDDIYEFLRQNSEKAAANIYNEILDGIDRLLSFPEMAPVEPMLVGRPFIYRSLVVRSAYKVVYRIEKQTIYIVDIWDCRQNPDTLKKRTDYES